MRKAVLKILSLWLLFSMGMSIIAYSQYEAGDSLNDGSIAVFDTHQSKRTEGVKERSINEATLKKIRSDDAFWYANLKPERTRATEKFSFWIWLIQQGWFKSLIWLLIAGGFAGVLIWYLASLNVHIFRKSPRNMEALSAGEVTEDIFSVDLAAQLQKAIQEQNYRTAIRIHFLQLLKELSQKNIIQYRTGLTNADYIGQLSSTDYYNGFFTLTRHFEYTWYGQMKISAGAFEEVQQKFERFKQQIPS